MTNAHIFYNPLRSIDSDPYQAYKNRLYAIREDIVRKMQHMQRKYREKRRQKMNMEFHRHLESDSRTKRH